MFIPFKGNTPKGRKKYLLDHNIPIDVIMVDGKIYRAYNYTSSWITGKRKRFSFEVIEYSFYIETNNGYNKLIATKKNMTLHYNRGIRIYHLY